MEPAKKKRLIKFFDRAVKLEYSGYDIQKQELRILISELRALIELTSESEEIKKEIKEKSRKQTGLEKALLEISDAYLALKHAERQKAQKIYKKILKDYKRMKKEERKLLYPHLQKLFKKF